MENQNDGQRAELVKTFFAPKFFGGEITAKTRGIDKQRRGDAATRRHDNPGVI